MDAGAPLARRRLWHQRAGGRQSRSRSDGTPEARDGEAGMPNAEENGNV